MKIGSRNFQLAYLECLRFQLGNAYLCSLFSHDFFIESNSSPFIYNCLDFCLSGFSEQAIVFVQVVLVRVRTFQGADEAEHAAITVDSALAGLRKTLSAPFDVVLDEVFSLTFIETVF